MDNHTPNDVSLHAHNIKGATTSCRSSSFMFMLHWSVLSRERNIVLNFRRHGIKNLHLLQEASKATGILSVKSIKPFLSQDLKVVGKALLCIPHSSASLQRIFSQKASNGELKIIKFYSRSMPKHP